MKPEDYIKLYQYTPIELPSMTSEQREEFMKETKKKVDELIQHIWKVLENET